jgi:hypothetical protein
VKKVAQNSWATSVIFKKVNKEDNRPNSQSEPNPTASIYSASVVNFYSAPGSLARLGNRNNLFFFERRSCLLQRWPSSCKKSQDWLQVTLLRKVKKTLNVFFRRKKNTF